MNCFSFLVSILLRQALLLQLFLLLLSLPAIGQQQERKKAMELYGLIQTDIGYNFDQADPDWFDALRATRLPQYEDQFAPGGNTYFSVRQTRWGVNAWPQTPLGRIKINFEFDLFGSGPDVGQTTFHLRKAYAELGKITVGQTESPFSDADVSPNILDYGAPPSRTLLRNILVRYMTLREKYRWAVALEKPGATSDEGVYTDRIDFQNVRSEFKVPDLTVEYRQIMKSGYIELAGALKWIRWDYTGNSPLDLSGDEAGWGFNLSAVQQLGRKTIFKGQFVYGKGIESHLTDAGFDIGIKKNSGDPNRPLLGVSLPVLGGLIFLEHTWTGRLSSTMGYSGVRIYNEDGQAGNAFKRGSYALLNLLYQPFSQFLMGAELQWGQRKNFNDGFSSSAVRVQVSFKYNYSLSVFENVNNRDK